MKTRKKIHATGTPRRCWCDLGDGIGPHQRHLCGVDGAHYHLAYLATMVAHYLNGEVQRTHLRSALEHATYVSARSAS